MIRMREMKNVNDPEVYFKVNSVRYVVNMNNANIFNFKIKSITSTQLNPNDSIGTMCLKM